MPIRMSLYSRRSRAAGGRIHARARTAALSDRLRDAPLRRRRAVVEHRLADHLDLHLALDAFDHPHEQVVGVVVGRRARVARAVLVVVPFADRQRVDHADPALRRHPRRLDHVRPGDVAPAGRHVQRHTARRARTPRRGRAARRRSTASRSAAGTSTRSTRRRRPARRCDSPTGSHSRRSVGTAISSRTPESEGSRPCSATTARGARPPRPGGRSSVGGRSSARGLLRGAVRDRRTRRHVSER